MSDLDLRDTSGTIIVDLPRNPSFPWAQWREPNVATAKSLGGIARASRRGQSLLVNRLTWHMMGPTQAAQLVDALRDYAGGAKALLLRVQGAFQKIADGTSLADGTVMASGDFRCRLYEAPEVVQVAYRKYDVTITLVQDIT